MEVSITWLVFNFEINIFFLIDLFFEDGFVDQNELTYYLGANESLLNTPKIIILQVIWCKLNFDNLF